MYRIITVLAPITVYELVKRHRRRWCACIHECMGKEEKRWTDVAKSNGRG